MKSSDKITKEFNKNWGRHKPFRNLNIQLTSIKRLKEEADNELAKYQVEVIPDWPILYYNLALIGIISGLEFFFRELVLNENILESQKKQKYYSIANGKFKGKFQNYKFIRKFLHDEFQIDIENLMTPLEIEWLKYLLMLRHIQTHNGGIIDKGFMDLINNFSQLKVLEHSIGKWVSADSQTISSAIKIVENLKEIVENQVIKLDKTEREIFFGS